MRLVTMDLVVRDVPAATRFFTEVVGLTPRYAEEGFAEIDTGSASIMLTAELMVDNSLSHLCVIDAATRRPVGVLSTIDIARVIATPV